MASVTENLWKPWICSAILDLACGTCSYVVGGSSKLSSFYVSTSQLAAFPCCFHFSFFFLCNISFPLLVITEGSALSGHERRRPWMRTDAQPLPREHRRVECCLGFAGRGLGSWRRGYSHGFCEKLVGNFPMFDGASARGLQNGLTAGQG